MLCKQVTGQPVENVQVNNVQSVSSGESPTGATTGRRLQGATTYPSIFFQASSEMWVLTLTLFVFRLTMSHDCCCPVAQS